jgi:hypothetical protein
VIIRIGISISEIYHIIHDVATGIFKLTGRMDTVTKRQVRERPACRRGTVVEFSSQIEKISYMLCKIKLLAPR